MANKKEKKTQKKNVSIPNLDVPPEVEKKLKGLKTNLDKLSKKVVEKFEGYILGISLLPPEKNASEPEKNINLLVLVDDTDSKKMSKHDLKQKIQGIIEEMAGKIDPNIKPQVLLFTEFRQSCFDAKTELQKMIALGAPVYDTGMLAAIKISEIHKTMVLEKFEKYIVSYVLAGSLVQGRATHESDIDVWIVIDDTDVKKMSRAELKDKLRAIIIGMGMEAGEITGIKNKLNIQVYILTDFWDSLKEANPIIFTLLRDGVPFYDRGVFMPWKQLLEMGKIKPSREAIDMFMSTGEQMLGRIKFKMKEMAMEDVYYSILTPSQAALMLYGVPPPTPRETPDVLEQIFVKKEKILEPKFIEILRKSVQVRKDLEHGTLKEISGKELDELLKNADRYLKRIDRLFKQLEKTKEEESILYLYERIITVIRDALKMEGITKAVNEEIISLFENKLIATGKLPASMVRELNEIVEAKNAFDKGSITKAEIEKARVSSHRLIKAIVEHMQRTRGRELDRARIRVKYGKRFGEVLLLGENAFIIEDIDSEQSILTSAPIQKDGSLGITKKASLEEMEHAIASVEIPHKVFIKEKLFENLKKIFGEDVEILVNY